MTEDDYKEAEGESVQVRLGEHINLPHYPVDAYHTTVHVVFAVQVFVRLRPTNDTEKAQCKYNHIVCCMPHALS